MRRDPARVRARVPTLLRLILLCAAMTPVLPATATGNEPQRPLRVLFIGNSYLYTNDLPAVVQALAADQGVIIEATLHAEPDYSLSDHLRQRRTGTLLEKPWDWVVLQQGPSALPESRRDLVESARRVATRLEGKPTRIALMSAWPAQRYAGMSLQAEASYREAATAIQACVLPAAAAWRIARAQQGAPALYAADRLHPTRPGTLLAAMTVTRGLLGMDPVIPVPAPMDIADADKPQLRLLDAAARTAESEETARCAPGPL